jgi:hypothetical protein
MGPEAIRSWAGIENQDFRKVQYGNVDAVRSAVSKNTAAILVEPARSNFDGADPGPEFFAHCAGYATRQARYSSLMKSLPDWGVLELSGDVSTTTSAPIS